MFWTLLSFIGLLFLGSCGQKDFPDYDDELEQREEDLGYYRANFKTINRARVGQVNGYVVMWANESQFYARINLRTRFQKKMHYQFIHKGELCPTSKADLNKDGFIDFEEVLKFSGPALIPLDQNLGNRIKGFDWFPSSNASGNYVYSRAASFRTLMLDLRNWRGAPNSNFKGLNHHEELSLQKRVVIVYGDGVTGNLPIACAELEVDPNPEI